MSNTFTIGDPKQADQWKAADAVGELVAFVEPRRVEKQTQYGWSEATECAYVVHVDTGEVFDAPIVFGNISKDAYSNGEEKIVLGVVTQGKAKPGQSAPFFLEAADDTQKAAAQAWFETHAELNAEGHIVIKG